MYKNRKAVGGGTMRKTESQKIALCGMLGALSVVLLLLGSALQIGTYAAPMLAAFLLIPRHPHRRSDHEHLQLPYGRRHADLQLHFQRHAERQRL